MNDATLHQWYRFLDVASDAEAVSELQVVIAHVDGIYGDIERACKRLAHSPDAGLDESMWASKFALSEMIEALQNVVARFRSGQHHVA